jgi:ceramide glucosyltransferase
MDAGHHDWIILVDANVLMPKDYIQRLLMSWRHRSGLVCSMPLGSRPGNLWAELECAFLNTFEARWQYCAEAFGMGFAQGKSMLWRREVMDKGGGIRALGAEIAEDAASTKLVRSLRLDVNLVDSPFEQPLGLSRLSRHMAEAIALGAIAAQNFSVVLYATNHRRRGVCLALRRPTALTLDLNIAA